MKERVVIMRGRVSALVLGVIIGAAIWAVSPMVGGAVEPWDSDGPFYFGSLLLSGVIGWFLFRKSSYFLIIGIYIGQLAYLSIIGFGPLFVVGSVLLIPYSLIAGVGAILAYALVGRGTREGSTDNSN